MIELRAGRLAVAAGLVTAPLVITGYLGLTVLLFLPLLGLRAIFPRRGKSGFREGRRRSGGEEGLMKLFVGNLSFDVTEKDLRSAFTTYGRVTSADVVMDRGSGRSRGFGFIEMPMKANALAAMEGLDGKDLKGRNLAVSQARPRSDGGRQDTPRGWALAGDANNRW